MRDATVFTKNRDRLLEAEVAQEFLAGLLSLPKVRQLLSGAHLLLYGMLIAAWASKKSRGRLYPAGIRGDKPESLAMH